MLALTEQTPKPDKKMTRLTNAEIATITRLLIVNADINDAERLVEFHDGWSDGRIHKIITSAPDRGHISLGAIISLRREGFGLLPSEHERERQKTLFGLELEQSNRRAIDALAARVAALEAMVRAA